MMRAEVNAVDFLKSILNVGDFTTKFKCNHYFINAENSRLKPKNWNVWPEMYYKNFFTMTFADIRNDYIYHNLLSFRLPSVFRFIYLIFGSSH